MPPREPLNPARIAVVEPWRIEAVDETGSTNVDLLQAAAAGAPEGLVRVAHFQNGGRGRLDRAWSSPPGAGLTFSVLLRPALPTPTWGWVPLLAGVAVAQTIGDDAQLKWPNDVLLGDQARKVAGILVQSAAGIAVVGIGLNVSTSLEELPVPTATSLSVEGLTGNDRENLLGKFLRMFDRLYRAWQDASGDAEASGLAAAYTSLCGTIGQRVSVQQPDGELIGEATGVDADGQLLVRTTAGGEPVAVAAGDVTHLRAISR